MIKKKKKQYARLIPYRYISDPIRRFVYGLLADIENLRTAKMIKPKPKRRISAVDCDGCTAALLVDSRVTIPVRCPKCGRHVSESIREFWYATARRERPAAGAHFQGFRRAKKKA